MSSDNVLTGLVGLTVALFLGFCLYIILAMWNGHSEPESGEIVAKELVAAYTETQITHDDDGHPKVRTIRHDDEYHFVVRRHSSGDGDEGGELEDRRVGRAEYYGMKSGDTFKWTRWVPDWTFWKD